MAIQSLLPKYTNIIRSLSFKGVDSVDTLPKELRLDSDGSLSNFYIPFDLINHQARLVLVGITPGFTQLINALKEAQHQIKKGSDDETVLHAAKLTGAFSGAMRPNLVAMLDHCKINDWLGIVSCDDLFKSKNYLIHTTSVLRFPVFIGNENYNGTPNMTKHPFLQKYLLEHFAKEVGTLENAIFLPLGPKVSDALSWLAAKGLIDKNRILDGMPHPSGANAERISYFLGRKEKSALSIKTNAVKIDHDKSLLLKKIASLK
jgi:hypothetical protein